MKPRVKPQESGSEELFHSKLKNIINLRHELVRLSECAELVSCWFSKNQFLAAEFVRSLYYCSLLLSTVVVPQLFCVRFPNLDQDTNLHARFRYN